MIVVRNVHAVRSAATLRQTRCEKCGCDYEYELIRRCDAYSSSVAPFGSDKRLQARAERKAEKKLAKMLAKGVDPVACPDCGWYQNSMVREVRRRRLRLLIWLGILPPTVLTAFAGTFLGLHYSRILRGLDPEDVERCWLGIYISAGVMFLCLGARFVLNRLHNPNAGYPEIGSPIRGAPAARRVGASAAPQTRTPIEPAAEGSLGYARQRPQVAPGGWITVQMSRMRFPEICCHCMAPTTEFHEYRVQELVSLRVRMCIPCSNREKHRQSICMAIGIITTSLLAIPLYLWLDWIEMRLPPRLFATFGFALAGGIGLGMLIERILARLSIAAIAFKNYNAELNTIDLRFHNQSYTDLFLDAQEDPP